VRVRLVVGRCEAGQQILAERFQRWVKGVDDRLPPPLAVLDREHPESFFGKPLEFRRLLEQPRQSWDPPDRSSD
jgi:hypothetical protein